MEKLVSDKEFEKYRNRCELVIDVRSPAEYCHDHIPGAINLPVLDNAQRAEVGTLHRDDPFSARLLGASYASGAIQRFLTEDPIRHARRATGMLIYCSRGGQRSGALAHVLSKVGFPVFRLEKGYRTYRRYVLDLFRRPLHDQIFVLHGYTGSGKTKILQQLRNDFNVIDLETLASHRGSLLGGFPNRPQPTQRAFESELSLALRAVDPSKPILVEGESRKIGLCRIPGPLWQRMVDGVHLWIHIPRVLRTAYILEDYQDLKDPERLRKPIEKLKRYLSREIRERLSEALAAGHWPVVVSLLLEHHYDPLYARSHKRNVMQHLNGESMAEAETSLRVLSREHRQGVLS